MLGKRDTIRRLFRSYQTVVLKFISWLSQMETLTSSFSRSSSAYKKAERTSTIPHSFKRELIVYKDKSTQIE